MRPRNDNSIELSNNLKFGILYDAWRVRYNQARMLTERLIPRLLTYSRLIPSVFTENICAELFTMIDEGNIGAIKEFLDLYQLQYNEALREEIDKRRTLRGDKPLKVKVKEQYAL